ncbi:MAG: 16S rRNA (cytosine(1402)-N(4))-methyltransferase RsmH, partial [Rikenellaceae bacterium]|nr:16S rRNA (cytosine(1402)-N(4))-methyltransferase RsmH [Rikenellaceae bacterium]
MSEYHVPVLLKESVDFLDIHPSGTYVDLTFGGGGHSREILRRLDREGRLFGFDQDLDVLPNIPDDRRFSFIRNNFRFVRGCLRAAGVAPEGGVDGILADLGVSSHHFDTGERGFSFRFDANLDMRMNREAQLTAREVVNTCEPDRLRRIFREYGELDNAGQIVKAIDSFRRNRPIDTIGELKEAVQHCVPCNDENKFFAKLFQALRIEVNREMEALKMMLEQALVVLRPGGRLAVITYHSLEDRLVKNFMRNGNFSGIAEKDFYGNISSPFELILKKARIPADEELTKNPRSRSAQLRV